MPELGAQTPVSNRNGLVTTNWSNGIFNWFTRLSSLKRHTHTGNQFDNVNVWELLVAHLRLVGWLVNDCLQFGYSPVCVCISFLCRHSSQFSYSVSNFLLSFLYCHPSTPVVSIHLVDSIEIFDQKQQWPLFDVFHPPKHPNNTQTGKAGITAFLPRTANKNTFWEL